MDKNNLKKYQTKLQSGFTLIEVMIVVVIIAILAAVALPSYQSYILRSKRADALNKLTDIANQQIQYFMDNRAYGSVANLNLDTTNSEGKGTTDCSGDAITEEGYYCIAITGTPSAYLLEATPQGSQAKDTECEKITYNSAETKGSSGGGEKCWGG